MSKVPCLTDAEVPAWLWSSSILLGLKNINNPLQWSHFKKVWIWGWPPQCGKNPHFLFFFFEGFPYTYELILFQVSHLIISWLTYFMFCIGGINLKWDILSCFLQDRETGEVRLGNSRQLDTPVDTLEVWNHIEIAKIVVLLTFFVSECTR